MSNETPEELLSISDAIKTITIEEERREYCGKMIYARLLAIYDDDRKQQRYLMTEFDDEIMDSGARGKWDGQEWYRYLEKFMEDLVIVIENYAVNNGYAEKQDAIQYTYVKDTLIEEGMMTYTSSNDVVGTYNTTVVYREIYPDDDTWTMTEVKVREFEDRYEERIVPPYRPDDDNDPIIVIKKVIHKRDLFRADIFGPIHNELLYSPDLSLRFTTFTNEATKAREHYESLQQ